MGDGLAMGEDAMAPPARASAQGGRALGPHPDVAAERGERKDRLARAIDRRGEVICDVAAERVDIEVRGEASGQRNVDVSGVGAELERAVARGASVEAQGA